MFNNRSKRFFSMIILFTLIFLIATHSNANAFPMISSDRLENKGDDSSYIDDISSNRYTRPEKRGEVFNRLSTDKYKKIIENDTLALWHNEKNASIRIVDKRSNYIWGGLPEEKPKDLNKNWSAVGNSLLTIDYFDKHGLIKKASLGQKNVETQFSINDNVLRYDVDFKKLDIQLSFMVILEDGSVIFKMLDESIKEGGKYQLAAAYFFPFLGSTRMDEIDGYMFVPDGAGALIRFGKPTHHLVHFEKRIYGKDYGTDNLFALNDLKSIRHNDFVTEEPDVSMPVFGVVHGVKKNAYFAHVDSGAEYCSIMATPSGIVTNYNWVTSKFIYRQKYLQPTSKSGSGIQVAQKKRNNIDAQISYYFITEDDADYVGMAKLYRDMLSDWGILEEKTKTEQGEIPIQIDLLGSDIRKGFLFNSNISITDTQTAKAIIDDLNARKINNLVMVLQGWQKGGINGNKPRKFNFEDKVGSKKDLQDLNSYIDQKGSKLYFYENLVTVNETQIDFRREGGSSLSQSLISEERDNPSAWFNKTYYINTGKVAEYLLKRLPQYSSSEIDNIALKDYGYKLYGENRRDQVITRDQALKGLIESAAEANSKLDSMAMYRANVYMWKYTDQIFDIPMHNSQYLFETDTVPFMQIVLKGSIDYFAPYTNMSFYSRPDILRAIEYGAYPSFIISGIDNHEMEKTPLNELYSTKYEDWATIIESTYHQINAALSKVQGMQIVDRSVIVSGLVKVDYSGNVSIVVNYTQSDYEINGIKIPAQGWIVIESEALE